MINIFFEGTKINRIVRMGKYKFAILEDDRKIGLGKIFYVDIKCDECKNITTLRRRSDLFEKEIYLCRSCLLSGDRNPFYGKKHDEKTKKRHSERMKGRYVGEKNPFYGKKHTEETRKKISENPRVSHKGKDNPFFGKKHTKESIDKIKRKNKEFLEDLSIEEKEKIRKKQRAGHKRFKENNSEYYRKIKQKAARISLKSQSRYRKNNIEEMFHSLMRENNIDVVYSLIMGSYQFDFGNKESKTLFEINGDYWHGNPRHYGPGLKELNETQKRKIDRDKEKLDWAESRGFKVITIWEYDLYNHPDEILKRIKNAIKV